MRQYGRPGQVHGAKRRECVAPARSNGACPKPDGRAAAPPSAPAGNRPPDRKRRDGPPIQGREHERGVRRGTTGRAERLFLITRIVLILWPCDGELWTAIRIAVAAIP